MVFCAAPLYDTAAHTKYNGYSVDDATKSMIPKSVSPKKFNLGLSLSGVTFTLKDKKKTSPGSPAQGPGKQGCQEKGAMAYFETRKLANNMQIADVKARAPDQFHRTVTQEPKMDPIGKCMYMVVDEDQWVGYDTPETFNMKMEYLRKAGYGGVSIWSMDSDSSNHELTNSIHSSLAANYIQGAGLSKAGSELATIGDSNKESDDEVKDISSQETTRANGAASAMNVAECAVKVMAAVAFSIVLLA
jgi:chitinase